MPVGRGAAQASLHMCASGQSSEGSPHGSQAEAAALAAEMGAHGLSAGV